MNRERVPGIPVLKQKWRLQRLSREVSVFIARYLVYLSFYILSNMKSYSQITFEFADAQVSGENAGVGIRIKSLKKPEMEDVAVLEKEGEVLLEKDSEKDIAATDKIILKSTRGRKSLKTIDAGADMIRIPPDEQLFQKQYYSIGEVAEMFNVNQSLLRFWETEFDIIQPRKNRKGDRHFRPVDIKNLLLIHDLLRRRKLTIEGAKDFLKKNKRSQERFGMIQSLQKLKGFLLEVKASL